MEAAGTIHMIKIWEEAHIREGPILRIQLVDNGSGYKALGRPLAVGEVNKLFGFHNCDALDTTSSSGVMKWARKQIDGCSRDHKRCGTDFMHRSLRDFRPTRLIDVGENADPDVRLIVTSELSTPETIKEYAALSYCWGNSTKTLLLEQNIDDMKKPTDFSTWDKNYQHAIKITRELGIRYLWIDALCIIQDQESQEDWLKEAPTMGLVYANATCVLSATASTDSQGGCFFPKMSLAGGCHLGRQGDTSLDVFPSRRHDTIMADLFKDKVESARLTTRAWAFQERVLASRILHFCEGLVLFECNEIQASSSHGFGQPYPKKEHFRLDGKMQVPLGPPYPPFAFRDWDAVMRTRTEVSRLLGNTDTVPWWPLQDRGGIRANGNVLRWNSNFPLNVLEFLDFSDLVSVFRDFKAYQEYFLWRTWRGEMIESARMGMRGAFEMLVHFKGLSVEEKIEFHSCWYEIVENYSQRNLTNHTDKLVAIQGLARFVPCHFVAGLWKEAFALNLLWMLERSSQPKGRPRRDIPTWSWASVDGPISHWLRVRASSDSASRGIWKDLGLYVTTPSEPTPEAARTVALYFQIPLFNLDTSKVTFYPDITMADESHAGLFCLAIFSFRNSHVDPYCADRQLHGIVVRAVVGSVQWYERVGYFRMLDQAAVEDALQRLRHDALTIVLV
uniref:Heterokaryon incompatibility domain-containing protein n=1 Tax=Bionectria ochroleuca TaxID=29856 RepID=A0A8H7TPG6_BIOOC